MILIPADEFLFEAITNVTASVTPGLSSNSLLDIDNISSPKDMICSEKNAATRYIESAFEYRAPYPPRLKNEGTQRLWVFSKRRNSASDIYDVDAPCSMGFSMTLNTVKQYLSMRGDA